MACSDHWSQPPKLYLWRITENVNRKQEQKNGCYLNSLVRNWPDFRVQFAVSLTALQRTKWGLAKWGASRHNQVKLVQEITPDRSSGLYSTWFPIKRWRQSNLAAVTTLTVGLKESSSNTKSSSFLCEQFVRNNFNVVKHYVLLLYWRMDARMDRWVRKECSMPNLQFLPQVVGNDVSQWQIFCKDCNLLATDLGNVLGSQRSVCSHLLINFCSKWQGIAKWLPCNPGLQKLRAGGAILDTETFWHLQKQTKRQEKSKTVLQLLLFN